MISNGTIILQVGDIVKKARVDLTGPGGSITADLYHTGTGASNEAIGVGGGLPVPAGLAPGAYAGTFSISADY